MPTKFLECQTLVKKLMIFPNFQGVGTLSPKVFRCVSHIHTPQHLHEKLDPRVVKFAPRVLPHKEGLQVLSPFYERALCHYG